MLSLVFSCIVIHVSFPIPFFFKDKTEIEGIYYIPSDPVSSWKSDPETSGNTAYGVLQGVSSASNLAVGQVLGVPTTLNPAYGQVQEIPTTPNPVHGKVQKQTAEL